jgi:hypothetical protein
MKREQVTWVCPKCKYSSKQSASISSVSHLCGVGRRPTALKPTEEELDGWDLL